MANQTEARRDGSDWHPVEQLADAVKGLGHTALDVLTLRGFTPRDTPQYASGDYHKPNVDSPNQPASL